jgi:hypothetical protein
VTLSNRTMKQLYPAYMKDDTTAQELQTVADAYDSSLLF